MCRSVWIQPKILVGHRWLFFQFFEIDVLTSTTASAVIHCLKQHFAWYGIPKCVVSDPGPQFVSSLFADFCSTWRILHVTSSPGHQNENGKAEAAVKSAKNMLKRTGRQHQDEYLALLELRNTPCQDVRKSPAEIMFGRVTRSFLPTLPKPCHKIDLNRRCKRQIAIKKYYDKRVGSLQPLCVGDRIMFQRPNNEGWQKSQIVRKLGARTYIIRLSLGVLYTQNTGTITRLYVLLNSVKNRPHPNEKGMLMMFVLEMITIRFAAWISGRIVSLQPDTDIQKLLSNRNRIRIRISAFIDILRVQTFGKKLYNYSFFILNLRK